MFYDELTEKEKKIIHMDASKTVCKQEKLQRCK